MCILCTDVLINTKFLHYCLFNSNENESYFSAYELPINTIFPLTCNLLLCFFYLRNNWFNICGTKEHLFIHLTIRVKVSWAWTKMNNICHQLQWKLIGHEITTISYLWYKKQPSTRSVQFRSDLLWPQQYLRKELYL